MFGGQLGDHTAGSGLGGKDEVLGGESGGYGGDLAGQPPGTGPDHLLDLVPPGGAQRGQRRVGGEQVADAGSAGLPKPLAACRLSSPRAATAASTGTADAQDWAGNGAPVPGDLRQSSALAGAPLYVRVRHAQILQCDHSRTARLAA